MGKITLNNDISKMFVGDDEVQAVYYGDILIYTAQLYDKFIFNVTTESKSISLSVSTGQNGPCDVTFDGETITVPTNSTNYTCSFSRSAETTANVSMEGDFVNVGMPTGKLNYVDTWYKNQNFIFNVFQKFQGNANLDFPSNIEDAFEFRKSDNQRIGFTRPYTLSFTNNLKRIWRVGLEQSNANVQLIDNWFYYIDDVLVNMEFPVVDTVITIPNNTRVICGAAFDPSLSANANKITGINFPTDGLLKEIPSLLATNNVGITYINIPNGIEIIDDSAFISCANLTSITIPSTVRKIGDSVFANTLGEMKISTMTFNQPRDMYVDLPTAGVSSGFLRVKTARNMDIYTDNLIIKNYDYSADNITPTFYHLDGTPW